MTSISGFSSYAAQIALQQQAQGQRRPQEEQDQQQKLEKTNESSATAKREALFRAILDNNSDNQANAGAGRSSQSRDSVRPSPTHGRGSILDVSA